ncbi:hypothetical protein [Maribellus maritimus]|uniref:hypothetical protein n=1 Tax=Maribellus maritimus TaxID=2870838 RepID=UPI001EEC22DD|nr:hypothetical protein [Maribellus maritimus]MCG6190300.1 hypothetical protein [Maribellus maritimus]
MKKYTFIFIAFCILLIMGESGICQSKNNFKLTGVRKYVYNTKNQQIEKQSFDEERNLVSFVHYIYDANGNKIETVKYSKDTLMLVRYVYVYSPENERTHCIKYDFTKNTEEKRIYRYNEQGQVIQTDYYKDSVLSKSVVAVYSDKGDCINKKRYNSKNKLLSENNYKCIYANEKLDEKWRLSGDGDALVKTFYRYNPNGTEKSYLRQYVMGAKPDVKREFLYNKNGLCVSSLVYESTNE